MAENDVLDSWKAIADYLGRNIRTCIRWEQELSLPVHRIDSQSPRSRVFAYKSEIEQWRRQKADAPQLRRPHLLSPKLVIGGAFSLALGFFLIFILRPFSPDSSRPGLTPPSLRQVKIAVLPFTDGNGAAYEEYLSVGLTQEIMGCLQQHKGLAVVSLPALVRNMPFSQAEQLGREMGLDYILRGQIEREKDYANLALEIIRAANQKPIWSSKYREPLNQLWVIKNDILAKMGEVLTQEDAPYAAPANQPAERTAGPALDSYLKGNFILSRLGGETSDPWTLYHQGRFYESQYTVTDNELAISLFRQAVALDQRFAPAYIGLAACYANFVNFNWEYDLLWLNRSEELLARAQELSPNLPGYFGTRLEVLLLRQYSFGQSQGDQIEALAQQGLKKYPNDPQINSLVGTHYFKKFGAGGRPEDGAQALRYKERAFWLNPYALGNMVYAELLLLNRDFDKAVEVSTLLTKFDASSLARFQLGEIYYYQGDLERSQAIFQSFQLPTRSRLVALFYLGMIHAQRGEQKEALQAVQEINLLSRGEFHYFDDRLKLASLFMGLGQVEMGYQYLQSHFQLERSKRERFISYRYIALDRNFDKVRKDEKFLQILNQKETSPWVRARLSALRPT